VDEEDSSVVVKEVGDREMIRRRRNARKTKGRRHIVSCAPDLLECFCHSQRHSRGEMNVCDQGNVVPKIAAMFTWKQMLR
jgi:hypothetical protein